MTLAFIFTIVVIILIVVLFLGVWNFIPIGQDGVNKLLFVLLALIFLMMTLQGYGLLRIK